MDEKTPEKIKDLLTGFSEAFGNDCLVIGGWAVWAYNQVEMSHVGDIMVTAPVLSELRDQYRVTNTPQKRKHQFANEEGFDVDLYVEHQHGLKVPFDEAQAYSLYLSGLHVVSPEHLMVLKLEAAKSRQGTAKGQKDQRDLLRLLQVVGQDDPLKRALSILARYLEPLDWAFLEKLVTNVSLTESISHKNSFQAKALRRELADALTECHHAANRSLLP